MFIPISSDKNTPSHMKCVGLISSFFAVLLLMYKSFFVFNPIQLDLFPFVSALFPFVLSLFPFTHCLFPHNHCLFPFTHFSPQKNCSRITRNSFHIIDQLFLLTKPLYQFFPKVHLSLYDQSDRMLQSVCKSDDEDLTF